MTYIKNLRSFLCPYTLLLDWTEVYSFYVEIADDVRKLNEPKTVTDEVNPKDLQDKWQKIRKIIHNIPSYDEVYSAMKKAGCKLTVEDIGKSQELVDSCIKYSPICATV